MARGYRICFNQKMNETLVTGFEPFDGRMINGSWLAARTLNSVAETLKVAVLWQEPLRVLRPICEQHCPTTIIALGEGREGWFDIETRARNRRGDRLDNHGNKPDPVDIWPGGEESLDASVDARALHRDLMQAGYPIRVSRDAGAFLCEEMLYTLEMLRCRHERLTTVCFVHLPPYGTRLNLRGRKTDCDEGVLAGFASALLAAVGRTSLPEQIVHNAAE